MKDMSLVVAYKLVIYLADFLEDVFWARMQGQPGGSQMEETSEVDDWNDETILEKYCESIQANQGLPESIDGYGQMKIYKITDKVVVKRTLGRTFDDAVQVPHEALAMDFVRKHTSIPVPRVLRTIQTEDAEDELFYVMDFVDGQQLRHVWPTLSIWGKLRVAWTLRSYIRQLRRIDSTLSSVPGPLGDSPQTCIGFIFESKRHTSFPNMEALFAWFHENARMRRVRARLPPIKYDPFHDCRRMVMTHMDLNMRNILVGKDGRIWIIDWDWSGFYPDWFEYVSMFFAEELINGPISWMRCIPFITDPYIERRRWLEES
ncbi:hypothetical protein PHLCEN_2v13500 [Hermanssonia centrifuga]|uniref:Aminoglycoside phosphotransferase domain-containing protein n=1 Tax=Hermanssonia centrifuga TaxID=98765 RepID=A0A2R6NE36_9APHY|nr:hypothetical protein PHLCEN_2v13500 [Hermanssonia centrifuga]